MNGARLNQNEQAVVDHALGWVRSYEIVKTTRVRKLLKVIAPTGEGQFYTLESDPHPRLIFHEPIFFTVTVIAAKGNCRADHQVGDRWEFSWCTPVGLCGSAYHSMYPVLHGLMMANTHNDRHSAAETQISCPDEGWLTFEIERHSWTPDLWER